MAEREFKVGDLVRVKSGKSAGGEFDEDNCGVIRHIGAGGIICSVDFFRGLHQGYGHDCNLGNEIIPDKTGWHCFIEDLELFAAGVVEFKGFRVGDRVVTVKKDSYHKIGCTGTVVGIECALPCPILVRFDKRCKIRGGGILGGILPSDSVQGVAEMLSDIKVIHPILGYIPDPEPEKPVEIKKYTDTVQVCIEKIKKLLTF